MGLYWSIMVVVWVYIGGSLCLHWSLAAPRVNLVSGVHRLKVSGREKVVMRVDF